MFKASRLIAPGLAALLLLASPAFAQNTTEPPKPQEEPQSNLSRLEKALTEALQRALNLFALTVGTWVPYRAPEVLPNGDIIIRKIPDAERNQGSGTPNPPDAPKPPAGKDTEERT